MYKILVTNYANKNIDNIKKYIGDYASFVVDKIFITIANLSYFPFLGFERFDGLREIIEPRYKFRIIYKIDGKNIYIISIFKDKNDWK